MERIPILPADAVGLLEQLSAHATLSPAPREELEWLVSHGTLQHYDAGDVLTKKGAAVEGMFIVLSGHVVIFVDRGAGPKKVMEWKNGDVTGTLPFSRMVSPPGDNTAVEPTTVLAVHRDLLRQMTRECYEITSILVHKMIDRAKQFNSSDQHDEKMVSLGRLAAGLAHELNNPAAAIERSATLLEDSLDDCERATLAVGAARLTDAQLAALADMRAACISAPQSAVRSPIEESEREDAIADWLDGHGVDSRIAGPLSETAVSIEALDQLAASVDGPSLDAVLRWVAAGYTVRGLASEIQDAASRISGLVAAVKGFTHMDQGRTAEPVNLSQSLANTVTVLKSKARTKSASIAIQIEPDLPNVRGFVGELNQIFANLIDNALDAVGQNGRIDVIARYERQNVVVRIVDNGPGIPPEVRERIFEPFFTTKPVGQGTGLGLDIVRRLLGHNDAMIDVQSQPGRTVFAVTLQPAEAAAAGARA